MGGEGSGHHGHKGRPGKRGGSLPSSYEWFLEIGIKGGEGSGNRGHRGIPGTRGGSLPRGGLSIGYFIDGEGEELLDGLLPHTKTAAIATFINSSIDERHIAGLNGLTNEDHPNHVGFNDCAGLYDSETGMIHIAPYLSEPAAMKVIAHELGHHVTLGNSQWDSTHMPMGWHSKVSDAVGKIPKKDLDKYGLRPYSLTDNMELFADIFKVNMMGDAVQRGNLANLVGVKDLDEVFKP